MEIPKIESYEWDEREPKLNEFPPARVSLGSRAKFLCGPFFVKIGMSQGEREFALWDVFSEKDFVHFLPPIAWDSSSGAVIFPAVKLLLSSVFHDPKGREDRKKVEYAHYGEIYQAMTKKYGIIDLQHVAWNVNSAGQLVILDYGSFND